MLDGANVKKLDDLFDGDSLKKGIFVQKMQMYIFLILKSCQKLKKATSFD